MKRTWIVMLLCLAGGCMASKVKIEPVTVQPIHVTIDVNVNDQPATPTPAPAPR